MAKGKEITISMMLVKAYNLCTRVMVGYLAGAMPWGGIRHCRAQSQSMENLAPERGGAGSLEQDGDDYAIRGVVILVSFRKVFPFALGGHSEAA